MPRRKSDVSASHEQPAAKPPTRSGPPTTLITVALALALLAVGVAGYRAASLLQYAVFGPSGITASPDSLASFTCEALLRQNYAQLASYIDPSPVAPSVTTPFDTRKTMTHLHTLDTSQGKVVACAAKPYAPGSIVTTDRAVRYQLIVRRANSVGIISGALVMRMQTSGQRGWLIGRDSSLLAPIPGVD